MTVPLVVAEEVREALAGGRAVVALETSVLAQGLPPPRNVEAASRIAEAIRGRGAVPAWTWADTGVVRVGVGTDALLEPDRAVKVARRDLPVAVAARRLGATTVSATLWIARRAGIHVMATGGIGGVHPRSGDVSADLLEMASTPGLVVCSGPKSIVDPVATAERLEELGVAIIGYRCDRLPFFLATEADVELEHRANDPAEAALVARAAIELGTTSSILLCNPVPPEHAMDASMVATATETCERRAEEGGVTGKDVTPFLLSCMAEETGGASLEANLALLEANAGLAAEVAVALGGTAA